jgi:hypothetical protein
MDIYRRDSFQSRNFSVRLFFGSICGAEFMSFEKNLAVTFSGQFPLHDLITSLNTLFSKIFQTI